MMHASEARRLADQKRTIEAREFAEQKARRRLIELKIAEACKLKEQKPAAADKLAEQKTLEASKLAEEAKLWVQQRAEARKLAEKKAAEDYKLAEANLMGARQNAAGYLANAEKNVADILESAEQQVVVARRVAEQEAAESRKLAEEQPPLSSYAERQAAGILEIAEIQVAHIRESADKRAAGAKEYHERHAADMIAMGNCELITNRIRSAIEYDGKSDCFSVGNDLMTPATKAMLEERLGYQVLQNTKGVWQQNTKGEWCRDEWFVTCVPVYCGRKSEFPLGWTWEGQRFHFFDDFSSYCRRWHRSGRFEPQRPKVNEMCRGCLDAVKRNIENGTLPWDTWQGPDATHVNEDRSSITSFRELRLH